MLPPDSFRIHDVPSARMPRASLPPVVIVPLFVAVEPVAADMPIGKQRIPIDAALRHFGTIVEAQLGVRVIDVAGAGAAGGLGAGLMAFAGGRLRPGVELVAEACGLADRIKGADLVITGEGRLDGQSARGQTPVGVARIAKRFGIPAIAVACSLGEGWRELYAQGIDAAISITPGPIPLSEALGRAEQGLRDTGEALARIWRAARGRVHESGV